MTDPHTRHTRGVLIVILLGVIFFALIALIVLRAGAHKAKTGPQAETVTVLPLRIRIRTEANARAAVVATATSGEQLQMLEDQGAWVRVQTSDNLTGWAERANLERTAERERRLARYAAIRKLPVLAGVTTDRAQLYAGPGIFYPLVGALPAATGVRVFTRDHDFYAIDYNDQIAYADVDAVDVTASGTPQFNVATTSAAPTDTSEPPATTTTSEQPPPETASAEPPPLSPVTATTSEPAAAGIYAAVPAGGTQPEEIDRVIPRYPALARQRGVSGSVVIRGVVRKDGTIDNVEIIKDLPSGLGDAAREAVEQWRFRPATYRGEPIDVYYTVTVNFRLR
ncbi:MAG TPA: TonB family protein [Thermoanaerobaculia bacterium]|nr:TonB family protein [Thermoanaerobaculia bacterium]